MAIDMKNFQDQIDNLEKIKAAIQDAIDRANARLELIQSGKETFEKVFETDGTS